MYLLLYCKCSKRVTQGFTVRGCWRPNRTVIYIDPQSYGRQRCVFLVLQGCSTGGPDHQLVSKTPPGVPRAPSAGCGFPYHILSPTSLIPHSSEAPRAPSAGLSLPHLISNFSGPQLSDFLFSPNYIIVQPPTQWLEWPVWSSSSGNNCHAVHRSLSSGASVYECTMGILPCPILLAKSTYTISPHKCHRNVSLPSGASLWNGILGRVEGQYITQQQRRSYLPSQQFLPVSVIIFTRFHIHSYQFPYPFLPVSMFTGTERGK